MRRLSLLGLFIVLVGVMVQTAFASISVMSGLTVAVKCNQLTIEFVFSNPFGYDSIDWDASVGGTFVGGGRLDGAGNLANAPVVSSRTVTLTRNILPGEALDVTLFAMPGGIDTEMASVTATTACASSGSGSSGSGSSTTSTGSRPVPPCKIDDGRLDPSCGAPITVFANDDGGVCFINVYSGYGAADGNARLVLAVPYDAIVSVPDQPATNTLIASSVYEPLGTIALYRLTSGEFQLNVGPYYHGDLGEVYVLNFSDCGATGGYNTNSYKVQAQ